MLLRPLLPCTWLRPSCRARRVRSRRRRRSIRRSSRALRCRAARLHGAASRRCRRHAWNGRTGSVSRECHARSAGDARGVGADAMPAPCKRVRKCRCGRGSTFFRVCPTAGSSVVGLPVHATASKAVYPEGGEPSPSSPAAASRAFGRASTIRTVSTDTWTMRRIAEMRSRGSANQPLGSLTMPLPVSLAMR